MRICHAKPQPCDAARPAHLLPAPTLPTVPHSFWLSRHVCVFLHVPPSPTDPINVIEGITLDGLYQTLLGGNLDPKEVGLVLINCFAFFFWLIVYQFVQPQYLDPKEVGLFDNLPACLGLKSV